MRRGHGHHAQFDVGAAEPRKVDLAVLRLAMLGDVEIGHDLEPEHDGEGIACRQLDVIGQFPIDAQPDLEGVWGRCSLDMDVGRAKLDGVRDQLVDEQDQRAVGFRGDGDIVEDQTIVVLGEFGGQILQAALRCRRTGGHMRLPVGARDGRRQRAGRAGHGKNP
ncbi:hypothetical protein GALL_430920 [mine drainage metagenome]|uniref:Uncharacterized protein n=1 Tax=mine drainage metagenome TaxID=410659 RepID=A0A1J5QGY4_9ZZZZ